MSDPCDIIFKEDEHEYYCRTHMMRRLPSVSEILRTVGVSPDYSQVNRAVLQHAADRGKAVHAAVELHELGTLDIETVDDEVMPYFKAYLEYRKNHKCLGVSSETRIGGCLDGYAGTADMVEWYERGGNVSGVLVELKSTSRVYKSAHVQAAAYARAMGLNEAYVLHLTPDGRYHRHDISAFKREEEDPWKTWDAAMTVYRYSHKEIWSQKLS